MKFLEYASAFLAAITPKLLWRKSFNAAGESKWIFKYEKKKSNMIVQLNHTKAGFC